MALRINTNVDAIDIQRNMAMVNNKVSDSLKRLSSGLRINSAKDDAAGFAVANSFKARISSMRVAYQNASEAQSMLQVADGAYNKIHDILIRMKDLATQSASGQLESDDRSKLNGEFAALQSEIDRIAESTKYGSKQLIDGSAGTGTVSFQVTTYGDTTSTNQIAITMNNAKTDALGADGTIDTDTAARTAMNDIDDALASINAFMGNIGAYQNRLQNTMENLNVSIENFSASESTIRDADMAFEVMQFTKNQILQQSGMAMLAQANAAPQQVLTLLR